MSRGYPSVTALLGLLAIVGYQNRDKIAEWVNAAQRKASGPTQLGGLLAGAARGYVGPMDFATWLIASREDCSSHRLRVPSNKPDTVK